MFNSDVDLLLCIAAVPILLLLLLALAKFFADFSRELKNLNGEIERSEGRERRYWIKRRRRLWLSILPFFDC